MGIFLTLSAYAVLAAVVLRILWRALVVLRAPRGLPSVPRTTPLVALKMAADVVLLRRLLRTNRWLWLGEAAFHISFLLVLAGHARHFLYPVPEWAVGLRQVGHYAGYVFFISLAYILVFRLAFDRSAFVSLYNFFLLCVAFLIGLTGILMHTVYRASLVDVKAFMLGVLALQPAAAPESALFILHFLLVLLFIFFLPSHVLAAPWVMMEARKREETLGLVVHER